MKKFNLDAAVAAGLQSMGVRCDANETAMFTRQLETIRKKTIDVEYADRKARMLFPVSYEMPAEDVTYTYRQFDRFGAAKEITNAADDLPQVEVQGTEASSKAAEFGISYSYSIDELARSAKTGLDLSTKKAFACREACEDVVEAIAAVGKGSMTTGFANATGISAVTLTDKATAAAEAWVDASGNLISTPAEVKADVLALVNKIFVDTKGKHQADSLLLGTKAYLALRGGQSSVYFKDSILAWLLETVPGLKSIDMWARLDTAGAGSKARVMAYKKDPEVLELMMAREFEQLPPQAKNMAFTTNCRIKTAGIVLYRPKCVSYMDGTET